MDPSPTYSRPEHQAIAELLRGMNAQALLDGRCFFGGGTAIVLKSGEYRLSRDVDFLCSSVEGYRAMRSAMDPNGDPKQVLGADVEIVRDFRADQYGIRGLVRTGGHDIKLEIIREARMALDGGCDADLRVPILSRDCLLAEKLLANADRGLDRSVAYRDAIDLGMMLQSQDRLPGPAMAMAQTAYGEAVMRSLRLVIARLSLPQERRFAADALQMQLDDVDRAVTALGRAADAAGVATDGGSP